MMLKQQGHDLMSAAFTAYSVLGFPARNPKPLIYPNRR